MARIKIKRSTTDQSTPSGLTFGELAYLPGGTGNTADRLFIGDNDATSVWIGAEIENSPQNWTNSTRLATQAATNSRISSLITSSAVTSFNGLTGSVQGVSAAVAGTGIAVSGATGAVTITNIGVQSFNGLTGQVTGASLGANTFTALNTFNAGISAAEGTFSALTRFTAGISAAGGVTFAGDISVNGLRVGKGAGNVSNNTAMGAGALNVNTSGNFNSAVGVSALMSNTTGNANTAVGLGALRENTLGNFNSAVGADALGSNTTGSSNVAIGTEAGAYDIGEDPLTDPENSIYIGSNARGFSNSDSNTIVIGANAVADGANTTVIGNSSTTSTRVFGTLSTNGGISAAGGTFSALTRFTAGISAAGATLSGTVTAPTPGVGTNNTQVATTAFVMANAVTSFNGLTGSVQGVSAAVAGTGISVSGTTGSVTITNTGVQSFNGLTGQVTGASLGANTFTALNTFNAGISAAGATFSSSVRVGTNDSDSQLDIRNHDTRYLSLIDNGSGSEIVSMGNNSLKIYQATGGSIYVGSVGAVYIGDGDGAGNSTYITVEDENRQIAFNFTSGYYAFPMDAGSAGQVLTTDGLNPGSLSWATPSAGTKTYAVFTPLDNQPPATNFATIDTRNSIMVLDFADSSADESAIFVGVIPEGASLGSGLKVRIRWMATTATSGAVRWGAQFMNLNTDCDSDSFDTATEGNTTTSGTSGTPNTTELTVTNIDGLAAGDFFRLKIYREQSDTSNDTMSGDAELIAVEVRSAS